ncbi:leucine-rich repeat domain-containing protein [Mycoplasma phocoenae]|uniref:Leucine-rich repeat domain-containing protein n=1 Tax=Mycoplasma phocoenae TaxID=754517 RepID=A0A858U471_9MOLU|nr:leucine-rich repeat domain-containing protein [Mycoplasma phocoenae]QJG66869.1 leucine-rich repeat domain-containing protein [Mycoplasma phocoenae]
MQIITKKIMISLMSITAIATPLVAVSCGNSGETVNDAATKYFKPDEKGNQIYYNKQTQTLDLSKDNKLEIITQAMFSKEATRVLKLSDQERKDLTGVNLVKNVPNIIYIKKVILPASLKKIEKGAFLNQNIEEIVFANSSKLELIEENAFQNNKIKKLVLPKNVTLKQGAFSNNELTEVTLNGLKHINESVFAGNQLANIDLTGVESIKNSAFANNAFSSVELPNSVTLFSPKAFGVNREKVQVNISKLSAELQEAIKKELSEKDNIEIK